MQGRVGKWGYCVKSAVMIPSWYCYGRIKFSQLGCCYFVLCYSLFVVLSYSDHHWLLHILTVCLLGCEKGESFVFFRIEFPHCLGAMKSLAEVRGEGNVDSDRQRKDILGLLK